MRGSKKEVLYLSQKSLTAKLPITHIPYTVIHTSNKNNQHTKFFKFIYTSRLQVISHMVIRCERREQKKIS